MCALIYAHVGYPMSATCLNSLKGKIPVESILRVEIGKRNSEYITPFLYRANAEVSIFKQSSITERITEKNENGISILFCDVRTVFFSVQPTSC